MAYLGSFEIEQYLDAGETIIVIGGYSGHHRKSNKTVHAPAAHVYDLAGRKISRFRQFADTKVIWDAMS